jgi:glutathione peroxidase
MRYRRLKFFGILLLGLVLGAALYVAIENRKYDHMTGRQKVIRSIYPLIMGMGKLFKKNEALQENTQASLPPVSFYSLKTPGIGGQEISFDRFRGKKVLIVNTASDCGFTPQYEDLQKLAEKFPKNLVIVGFPANDFHEQEKGTDQEIASFCSNNYHIGFPMASKSIVIKTSGQNPVFRWLTQASENGWNSRAPVWNFSKYLVNEKGVLTHYFDPTVSPLSMELLGAIEK